MELFKSKENIEVKVGSFIFIGIVLLVGIIFSIGDFYLFKPGYNLKIIFGFINGVEVSSPVRYAGVNVGEVKKIKLFYDEKTDETLVEVLIWVQNDIKISKDAKAYVNALGLLGEKYIEINPGSDHSGVFKPNEIMIGKDPISIEELTRKGYKIADQAERSLGVLVDSIGDKQFNNNLKEMVANLRSVSENMAGILNENKDNISSSLKNLDSSLVSLDNLLTKMDRGEGTVGKLVSDEELYNEVRDFVKDIKRHPWKLFRKGKEKKDDNNIKKTAPKTNFGTR